MVRRLAIPVAALSAGFLGQRLADARSRKRFSMPGRLVEVDGEQIHVVVEGSGPTVLLDSGLGGSGIEWGCVAADLSRDFTVVRYDRPGFGWSPPASGEPSPRVAAQRIRSVLTTLGVPLPAILVGHSLGGLHVGAAAALYPEVARGLVLVDPSHEDMLDVAGAAEAAARMNKVMGILAAIAPLGSARLAGRLYGRTIGAQVRRSLDATGREALQTSLLLTVCSVSGFRACVAEMTALPASLRQAKAIREAHTQPPIPVTVISADAPGRTAAERTGRVEIRKLHEAQAAATPFGRVVLAPGSGHLVPLDEPELIARCVRETAAASHAGSWGPESAGERTTP